MPFKLKRYLAKLGYNLWKPAFTLLRNAPYLSLIVSEVRVHFEKSRGKATKAGMVTSLAIEATFIKPNKPFCRETGLLISQCTSLRPVYEASVIQ